MRTQLEHSQLALPPPLDLDLTDSGRTLGWIAGNAVGFRGFADETEAAHAAWVAYRTIARRLARTHGTRRVPVDIEPLAIQRVESAEMIVASGRPIATLVRPGPESRSGVDSFGFELLMPAPMSERQVRGMAHLVYRTLRKSGIRWAVWRSGATTVPDRPRRAALEEPAVPAGGVSNPMKIALAVLPLSVGGVLVAGVAQLVTIPLTAALLAGMGAGSLMLFRSGRLR